MNKLQLRSSDFSRLSAAPSWLRKNRKTRLLAGSLLLVAGILVAGYGISHSEDSLVDPQYPPLPVISSPPSRSNAVPVKLDIPSQNLSLAVTPGAVHTNNQWDISRTGLSYLKISAPPGSGGNTVIYGHNWRGLLKNLPKVAVDDQIQITTADNVIHTYAVTQTFDVSPTDVSILEATNQEVLTIYTCSGPFDQKRRVVRATPV